MQRRGHLGLGIQCPRQFWNIPGTGLIAKQGVLGTCDFINWDNQLMESNKDIREHTLDVDFVEDGAANEGL